MAKKTPKKTSAKAKPAKAARPKTTPAKKAKPAVKKPAVKAKKKAAPPPKITKKPAAPSKKTVAVKAKKNIPSVKKATPKKAVKAPVSKTKAPVVKPAAKAVVVAVVQPVKGKTNGAVPVAPKPVTKKGTKAPFMPLAAPTKPVPIPKVKPSLIENAPEIAIKPVFNPKKMPPFFKKQHNRLLELRSALYDTMDGMAKETLRSRPEGSDASVGGMHMGDAGSDAYDRDFALSMLSKEQDALYEINEAISRLERGVYGVCELSGKKINEERLEALPYTRYTREMQEQIERDNTGGKFRRPVVKSVFGLDDAAEEDDEEEGETPTEAPPQESSLDFMKE
jgi:RNA polymerase-binding transcription factor DksA